MYWAKVIYWSGDLGRTSIIYEMFNRVIYRTPACRGGEGGAARPNFGGVFSA